MQRPASRSRFDVVRDTRFPLLAAAIASGRVPLRRAVWSAAVLMVIGLRSGSAAETDNVLLDFMGTSCMPCQRMSPIVSKLERQGYSIRKIDVAQEPALVSRFNVQQIPCFVLIANGQEIDRVTGSTSEQQLLRMLNRLPKPAPAVAQEKGEPRNGNGSSSGGLGLPLDIGRLDQLDRKRPPVGPPSVGIKPKGYETAVAEVPLHEQTVPRGQSPDNVAADPLLASVRLRVQDGTGINFGSGTIIDSKPGIDGKPGRTVILTCGHIFRKAGNDSKVEVDLFGPNAKSRPEVVQGKVLHFDLDADVGLVTIVHAQRLPVVRLGSSRVLAAKDRVLSIGCGGGDRPTREDVTLTAINKYDGPDNIECTGMPQQGRSGGGLFLGGDLIGVCIAAEPVEKRGIYAGMKPIAQLLDKLGMGHLAPLPPAASSLAIEGPLAATHAEGVKTANLGESAQPDRGLTPADDIGRFFSGGAAAFSGPAAAPEEYEGAEIICIVRPKTPGAASRVVIVNQASPRFVGDLLHESQAPAERATAGRDKVSPKADQRPIETSFEPPPYRRQRGE